MSMKQYHELIELAEHLRQRASETDERAKLAALASRGAKIGDLVQDETGEIGVIVAVHNVVGNKICVLTNCSPDSRRPRRNLMFWDWSRVDQ